MVRVYKKFEAVALKHLVELQTSINNTLPEPQHAL